MRVLYITCSSPWNPRYGGAMRDFGIIRGLSQKHDLHIALASTDSAHITHFEQQANPGLGELHVLQSTKIGQARSQNRGTARQLGTELARGRFRESFLGLVNQANPDAVWYFQKAAVRSTGFPRSTPSVLDLDNVSWRRLLLTGQNQRGARKLVILLKLAPYWFDDFWLSRRANTVVIANPEETSFVCHKSVIPVANGFDFPPTVSIYQREQKRVLFVGSLFYHPNLDGIRWFCKDVWPHVLAAIPEAHLDIVGLHEQKLNEIGSTDGVTLHGFVENLERFFAESAFLVVPLRIASGTRIKILEAWSMGLPVVSTTIGAEGLDSKRGQTVLIGDSIAELADACIRLLRAPDLGTHLARNAFEHGKKQLSWQSIYPAIERVLDSAVGA